MKHVKNNLKKYGIFYLLCLLFAVLCVSLYIDNVEAAPVRIDIGATGDSLECVTLTTSRQPNIPSEMSLGGQLAFCIQRTVYTTAGTKYRLSRIETNSVYVKAFNFYKKYGNNNNLDRYYYAIAQTKVWGMSKNNARTLIANYLRGLGYNENEIMKGFEYDWANFDKMSGSGVIYVWESIVTPGNKQQMITMTKPSTTTCEIDESDLVCYTKNGKYYGVDGKEVTKEEYEEQCDNGFEPEDPNKTCPNPTGVGAGDCSNGRYIDPTFDELKQCDTNKDQYKSDIQISETYCKAYCIEEVNTLFPGDGYTFQAGQYFTIGSSPAGNSWGPISFTGVRTCKSFLDNGYTEGVNTKQFIQDYNSTVLSEITAYNNAKNEERKQEAINQSIASSYSNNCDTENDWIWVSDIPGGYVCSAGLSDGSGGCWNESWTVMIGWATWQQGSCPSGSQPRNGGCYRYELKMDTWYPSKSYVTYNNNGGQGSGRVGGHCNYIESASPNWGAYESAKSKRLSLENVIQKCNSFNFEYNLLPDVYVDYTEDEGYQFPNQKLTSYEQTVSNTINGGAQANVNGWGSNTAPAYCQGSNCQLVHYECSGEKCTYSGNKSNGIYVAGVNVKEKTSITHTYVDYSLDTEYRYASKIDGSVKKAISNGQEGLFIDLGDTVVPISYTLVPKKYNIYLSYQNIGHNGRFNDLLNTGDGAKYNCPINIKNDILCKDCDDGTDPSGIDVIYRPIELGEQDIAFPGIDGEGRSPGANWVGTLDNGQSLVDAYITHNRGVSDYEVYDMEPLYTITMTPTLIKQIREYNKKIGDYSDFNLECNDGRQCYSEFIHESEFASEIGGLCGDSQRGQFDSCRTYGGAN